MINKWIIIVADFITSIIIDNHNRIVLLLLLLWIIIIWMHALMNYLAVIVSIIVLNSA